MEALGPNVFAETKKVILDKQINKVSIFIDCGSVVNSTLKSPGYPSYYPNSMDCNYSIAIPNGMAMEINFHDFVVEDHRHCG